MWHQREGGTEVWSCAVPGERSCHIFPAGAGRSGHGFVPGLTPHVLIATPSLHQLFLPSFFRAALPQRHLDVLAARAAGSQRADCRAGTLNGHAVEALWRKSNAKWGKDKRTKLHREIPRPWGWCAWGHRAEKATKKLDLNP